MRSRIGMRGATLGYAWVALGCHQIRKDSGQFVVEYADWLNVVAVVLSGLFLWIAWNVRRETPRLGTAMLAAIPFSWFLVMPTFWRSEVVVSDAGMRSCTGFWLTPARREIDFAMIHRIEIQVDQRKKKDKILDRLRLVVLYTDARVESMVLGYLQQKAIREFIKRAKSQGIEVTGEEILDGFVDRSNQF